MEKKNILIVGNNIYARALMKKLLRYDNCGKLYVVSTPFCEDEGIEFVDLRAEEVDKILEFAVQNDIGLTICASKTALKADITGLFSANGQMIFACDAICAKSLIDEGLMKKLLYRLKIPTKKFAILEKAQAAYEYLKTAKFPLVIQSCEPENERDIFACPTVAVANIAINDLFFKNVDKILIEEYQSGHRFTLWTVTDGFKILPVNICENKIFSDCPEGGFITFGSASILPDNFVDKNIENFVINNVIQPIITNFENTGTPYLGFIGARCCMNGNDIYVEKIYTMPEDSQAQILLNSIDENLINLFNACAIGSFSDDYEEILTNEFASVSVSLFSRNEEKEIILPDNTGEFCDFVLKTKIFNKKYYTQKGFIGTLSASANTLTSAKRTLCESLDGLNIDGLKYRKDILDCHKD